MRSLPVLLTALLLTACAASQVQTTTQIAGYLATVAAQYDEARAALSRRIAQWLNTPSIEARPGRMCSADSSSCP